MNIFQKGNLRVIISAVVMIVLGILFCVLPEQSLNTLEIVVSGLLIFIGMVNIFAFSFAPGFSREGGILFLGIISLGLGVFIIFVPSSLILGLGLYTGFIGIKRVMLATNLKAVGDRNWWVDLAVGILVFVLGVLLIVLRCTNLAINAVMIYMGVSLLLEGILDLVMLFAFKREITKIKSFFRKVATEITEEEKISDGSDDSDNQNLQDFTDFDVK